MNEEETKEYKTLMKKTPKITFSKSTKRKANDNLIQKEKIKSIKIENNETSKLFSQNIQARRKLKSKISPEIKKSQHTNQPKIRTYLSRNKISQSKLISQINDPKAAPILEKSSPQKEKKLTKLSPKGDNSANSSREASSEASYSSKSIQFNII